jgi:hypothetical protein
MDIWKPSEELARRLEGKPKFSLSDLKSEVPRLSLDQLAFAVFVFVADKLTKGEPLNDTMAAYYLGHQILRYYLGDQWVESNVFDNAPGTAKWHRQSRAFLKSDSIDREDNFRHQHRVIELADCLYNLQDIPGIDQRIQLMQRDNLLSAFVELQCARIMATPSCKLRFITPQNEEQPYYDAEITTPAGRTICCEIKAKDETTVLDERAVISTIEQARKQLPKSMPGMVWITIPETWSTQPGAKAIVDKAVLRALGKSGRLVAVLVAFEVWETVDTGRLMNFRFVSVQNVTSRFYQDDVDAVIQEFGSHRIPEWYTLDRVIEAFYPKSVDFVRKKLANEI